MSTTTDHQSDNQNSNRAATSQHEASSAVEREDLISSLGHARYFVRYPARGLDEDKVRRHTTPSAFCLGDIIKHVTAMEQMWSDFITSGKAAIAKDGRDFVDWTPQEFAEYAAASQMQPEDTLAGLLAEHERVAAQTDARIRQIDSLDTVRELPKAPWPMDEEWTVRRTVLHIVAETVQHAGHADIIREALDGAKSMG